MRPSLLIAALFVLTTVMTPSNTYAQEAEYKLGVECNVFLNEVSCIIENREVIPLECNISIVAEGIGKADPYQKRQWKDIYPGTLQEVSFTIYEIKSADNALTSARSTAECFSFQFD